VITIKPKINDITKLSKDKKYCDNDTSYTSLWLYKKNDEFFTKNFKDELVKYDHSLFSEFNSTVAKNIVSYWSDEDNIIIDPFAGRTRGFVCGAMNRKYYGFEIIKKTYDYLMIPRESDKYLKKVPTFINDDSNNIINYDSLPMADLIFTCSLYWKLEKYSDNIQEDFSIIKDYNVFVSRLSEILIKSTHKLKKGGYLAIVIGNFRINKKYYPLHSDLLQELQKFNNIELHDLIAIQNLPFYVGAIYFGKAKKNKKVTKVHEYLLIFKKT